MEFSFHVLVFFLQFKLLFMGIFLKKIIYYEIPKLVNMFFTNRHSYYPWLLDCIFQMTIAFKTMSFSVVLSSHQKPKRLPEILSFFSSKNLRLLFYLNFWSKQVVKSCMKYWYRILMDNFMAHGHTPDGNSSEFKYFMSLFPGGLLLLSPFPLAIEQK